MIGALIGPLTSLIGSFIETKTEAQRGKASVARVKAEAESAVMVSAATSTAEWERLMAKNANNSWADELYACIFALPLVLAFAGDWGRHVVENGFTALEACPDWYKAALGVILSATFATRQASKFFGNRK